MSEFVFPVFGAVLVFFVVVPALTLMARSLLPFVPTRGVRLASYASLWRLVLVLGPSLAPLIWLISASIHQTEKGAALTACIVDHLSGELCGDVVLFGLLLFSVLGYGVFRRVRKELGSCEPALASMSSDASTRIRELCTWSTALSGFGSRVRVVTRGLAPACTRGLFRPRIELEAALVMRLDDDELEATLLHELEHANARDPLRFFLAYVALSINPLGSLLSSELARYHFAREAACDRSAVRRGADPLALARSIVSVAAPKAAPVAAAALGGHSIEAVHVRVELLLGYAAHRSAPAVREAPIGVVASLIVLLAMSPHFLGAAPLDVFHQGVEQTALLFGLG